MSGARPMVIVGECRVRNASNVIVLFHYLLWKAKLDLGALGEGLDSSSCNVSFSIHCLLWRYESPSLHYTLQLLCSGSFSALALVHVLSVALLRSFSSLLLSFAGDASPSVFSSSALPSSAEVT